MTARQSLVQIDAFVNQSLRRVSMHIDDDGPAVNRKRIGGGGICRGTGHGFFRVFGFA